MGADGRVPRPQGTLGERAAWLGSPGFLLCVALLILNDHLLKERFPGVVTGKLSDLAGVAVWGVVLSVAVGPRSGLLLTAVLFTALKTVPGAAEAAAPVLGGVTRRDPSDVLALVALVPSWWLLADRPIAQERAAPCDASSWRRLGATVAAATAGTAPVVGAIVAVAATTATACSPTAAVTTVASDDRSLHAYVDAGYGTSSWARSTDGGLTWTEEATPAGAPSTTASPGFEDPGPSGPLQACIDGGPCWRLRDRRAIDRQAPSGEWVEEVVFTADELADVDTGCAGGSIGILGSIAASGTVETPHVVAAFGADGALVRSQDGTWDQVPVLTAPPAPAGPVEWTVPVVVAAFGPVLGLAIWLVGRRRWPCWPYGLATAAAGWMATLGAIGGLAVLFGPDADPTLAIVAVAVIGTGVTTVASILIARWPLRTTPLPPLAPRPPSAPPPPRS